MQRIPLTFVQPIVLESEATAGDTYGANLRRGVRAFQVVDATSFQRYNRQERAGNRLILNEKPGFAFRAAGSR